MHKPSNMPAKLAGPAVIAAALVLSAGIFYFSQERPEENERSVSAHVARGEAALIDVRTAEEWSEGHAAGAEHFELARLQKGELPPLPKDSVIYLYCRTGRRAEEAKGILERSGFTNVVNIGGLADWQAEGGVVVK